jgi:hypothetical protein
MERQIITKSWCTACTGKCSNPRLPKWILRKLVFLNSCYAIALQSTWISLRTFHPSWLSSDKAFREVAIVFCHVDLHDSLAERERTLRMNLGISSPNIFFVTGGFHSAGPEFAPRKQLTSSLDAYIIFVQSEDITDFSLSLFFFRLLCGLSMFKTLFSVLNTCHFKIFKTTTCFGQIWPKRKWNNNVRQDANVRYYYRHA